MRCLVLLASVLIGGLTCCSDDAVHIPPPPSNHIVDIAETLHGVVVRDPYRWLEDGRSAETRDWVARQNAYCDTVLQQIRGRKALRDLISDLVIVDRVSCPIEAGGKYFYMRYRGGDHLPMLCVREGEHGAERILVDPHRMSPDHSISVDLMDVASDGSVISYAVREGGADETHIRFLDVKIGRDFPEILPLGRYSSLHFSHDNTGVYYTRQNADGPRLYFHRLRNGMVHDVELHGDRCGPEVILHVDLSDNGRWMLITELEGSVGPTALYLADIEKGTAFSRVIDDGKSRNYAVFAGDQLVIRTNRDAPRWRVMKVPCHGAHREKWTEVIAEQENAVILDVKPADGRLLVRLLENVAHRARLYDMEGTRIRDLDAGVEGSISEPMSNWNSRYAFLGFTSFHIPDLVYRFNLRTGERSVWFRREIPVATENYVVHQVHYASSDGTEVPMYLLHAKGMVRSGNAPTIMYGFGGFGVNVTPEFSALAAAFVNAGGIFAVPNLRGGGEFGEEWHEAGQKDRKQNAFDDFIAAAEYLIDEEYTRPERLGMCGASNGGLLVGACITQRPDLFGAAVCCYPLFDMLRYHLFHAGRFWLTEYGSSADPEQFPYIYAYSPYHHVRRGAAYPAVLIITGEADTRVDPLHARKMTALLQAANGGDAPILLRSNPLSGHEGGQTMPEIVDECVDIYSFLYWRLGLRLDPGT